MFGRRFHLFRLLGFPIRVDLSWFVVAVLVTWSLAEGLFPRMSGGLSDVSYWWMGIAGALGLFASVVLHELGHAVVARRFDLPIREIVLFVFGGVARMEKEPPHPRAEFLVAIGGPIVSAVLALAFFAGHAVATAGSWAAQIRDVLGYLAAINGIIVAFNLVPAFPLDGGRVLRSILWASQGSLRRATRVTSAIGSGFGLLLILLGLMGMISGNFIGGLWWALIGLFLQGAAGMSYQQLVMRRALEDEPLRRFMNTDPVTVPRKVSIREAVDDYVYRHHHKMLPVTDGDRLLGCLTTAAIKTVPKDRWEMTTAGELAERCGPENTIDVNADSVDALSKMSRGDRSRLMVVDDGRLAGIVSLKDMLRFLSLKIELEGLGAEASGEGARNA